MKLQQSTWRHLLWTGFVVVALLLLSSVVMAQEAVIVQLDPVGESGVSGTATLIAAGEGTSVTLDIEGLTPGMEARATMHANTCEMPSVSFSAMPNLKADAAGKATTTGSVLFHNMDLALDIMADGEHVITIHADGEALACGVIPRLTSTSAPQTLPVTGGAVSSFVGAGTAILGFCAVSAGLLLRRRGHRTGDPNG